MKKTISPTGNNLSQASGRGFTFVEVMVAVAVLSFGIIVIFKAFVLTLDVTKHLAHRLQAMDLLTNRIARLQKVFEIRNVILAGVDVAPETIQFENEKTEMKLYRETENVDGLEDIYKLTMTASWKEGQREVSLSRSAYINYYASLDELQKPVESFDE